MNCGFRSLGRPPRRLDWSQRRGGLRLFRFARSRRTGAGLLQVAVQRARSKQTFKTTSMPAGMMAIATVAASAMPITPTLVGVLGTPMRCHPPGSDWLATMIVGNDYTAPMDTFPASAALVAVGTRRRMGMAGLDRAGGQQRSSGDRQ